MIRSATTAAILTGDLVASTEAGTAAIDRAMEALEAAAAAVARWPNGTDTRFTRFRGDGWQMMVAEPGLGLRAALVMTARLRATDLGLATRAAIGIGAVARTGTGDLADAGGAAFTASGHALDGMGHGRRLAADGDGVTQLHRAVVDLLDERTGRWTMQQAEAAALYLHPGDPTLADLAPGLGISTQAVNYRVSGAGAAAMRRALEAWEATFGPAGGMAGP